MVVDIFDVDEIDSVLRQKLRQENINLREFKVPVYEIEQDYQVEQFRLSSDRKTYLKQVRRSIENISEMAESRGFDHNIFTALYEAVLNAHQHGNHANSNKKILLAHNIEEGIAKFVVIDEGGNINPEFIPFVLRHREGRYEDGRKIVDFYKFTHTNKPEYNNGTGTSFIHMYMDEVHYYKHVEGGLAVHMTRRKRDQGR